MTPLSVASTTTRGRVVPPSPALAIGMWQLERRLGEGQWTEVYQARPSTSPAIGTADYVVKRLKPEYQEDPLAIRMLQREVYVTQQVRHPHLSSILFAHADRSPHYVVLPYLPGDTLADMLRQRKSLDVPQSLWLTRQTAEALQALHQAGWLHGDVKPANIVVARNGHVTLVDLGLARRLDAPRATEAALAGSLAYASPELFHEQIPLSSASDVYSLGITLYETLTGVRPFPEDDAMELAAAHLTQAVPDPRRLVPNLPPGVGHLLRRMLAKDPLRRPAIDELIDALVALEVDTFDERVSA